jgi:hypothetical protein
MIRRYSELRVLRGFDERYRYLKLVGEVGVSTFGFDRWINQEFYRSSEWKSARRDVVIRDNGCDLGVDGYEIHDNILVHHMNPMHVDDVINNRDWILDPEFLITTTQRTHNAIHYGDERLLPRGLVERKPGDTKLW